MKKEILDVNVSLLVYENFIEEKSGEGKVSHLS